MRYRTVKPGKWDDNKLLETKLWHKIPKGQRLVDIHETIYGNGERGVEPFPDQIREKIREFSRNGYELPLIDELIVAQMQTGRLPNVKVYITDERM